MIRDRKDYIKDTGWHDIHANDNPESKIVAKTGWIKFDSSALGKVKLRTSIAGC